MKSKSLLIFLTIVLAVSFLGVSSLFAQEKMKYEDYLIELEQWKAREDAAKAKIATLEAEIAALRQQLRDLDSQIQRTEDTIWSELGTDPNGLQRYLDDLRRLRSNIQGLLRLSPGDLFKQQDEAASAESRFEELSGRNAAKHPDARTLVNEIRGMLNRLRNAVANAEPPFDVYDVVRGDCLWNISKKPEVYNDPFQWIRVYTKNRDLIKNPDLIFPGQNFKIFHNVLENEHMVAKGENLSLIAKNLFNDPFQWRKLLELNQSVIQDQNLIYPYMILYIK
ncbi:LysM peptidoglycan-binding domain-containing protein [candidate division KSB1 bacterium]